MQFDKKLIIISLLAFVVIFLITQTGSGFGNIDDIINDNYSYNTGSSSGEPNDLQYVCGNVDLRVIPSGRLPGSTILLTDSEKRELLRRFIENGPNDALTP